MINYACGFIQSERRNILNQLTLMGTLPLHFKASKRYTVFEQELKHFMEGTFFIGGGGRAEASEGRVLSNFFTNWEGQTCFILSRERVTVFWARKNYSMSLLFCIYKQSYQSRLI